MYTERTLPLNNSYLASGSLLIPGISTVVAVTDVILKATILPCLSQETIIRYSYLEEVKNFKPDLRPKPLINLGELVKLSAKFLGKGSSFAKELSGAN